MTQQVKPVTMPATPAAQYLGIGVSSLYGLARSAEVETCTCGRRRLFITASLDAYIERRRAAEGSTFRPQNLPWRPKVKEIRRRQRLQAPAE